jgi:hypothetical protein
MALPVSGFRCVVLRRCGARRLSTGRGNLPAGRIAEPQQAAAPQRNKPAVP